MTSMLEAPAALVNRAVAEAEQLFSTHTRSDFAAERVVIVHSLTRAGYTAKEISAVAGIKQRQVERLRQKPSPDDLPKLPAPEEIPVDRATELAKLAEVAAGLAWRLRDEDPRVVRAALQMLTRETLEDLATIALVGMDIDRPMSEVFSWVLDLPAAQEDSQ